jgi:lysophospholipase L1-like esterase
MGTRKFFLLGLIIVALSATPAASAASNLPNSMAGIGDSMTQAADVCCWYGDHPANSWSTGDAPADGISSHYERILALKPSISGRNYNDSRSGAKMRDALVQAQAAVTQRARYVTILMGANDVCTSSLATMTSVSDFRAQFVAAMDALSSGLPAGSQVFVGSIPNIYQLWQIFHDNATAQLVWWLAQICQSMLSLNNTEQDRLAVLAHARALNNVLADVCSQYEFCRFDDYAVFDYKFNANQVSKLDYFHPSLAGQAALASLTWQRSWWPGP